MVEDGNAVQGDGNTETPAALDPAIEARVQQMIAEATAKAVEAAKDAGRRELQSQQDRNKAEIRKVQREATASAKALEAVTTKVKELDPDSATAIELERLKAENQARADLDKEEQTANQNEATQATVKTSLETHLEQLGIKKDDPRVDWAMDAPDYLTGRNRFDASVAAILKEDRKKETDTLASRLAALEAKLNGEDSNEANSVSTETNQASVNSSDQQFLKDFGSGKLPMSKANYERATKLQKSL
jgi:hypothetical protein